MTALDFQNQGSDRVKRARDKYDLRGLRVLQWAAYAAAVFGGLAQIAAGSLGRELSPVAQAETLFFVVGGIVTAVLLGQVIKLNNRITTLERRLSTGASTGDE